MYPYGIIQNNIYWCFRQNVSLQSVFAPSKIHILRRKQHYYKKYESILLLYYKVSNTVVLETAVPRQIVMVYGHK